MDLIIYHNRWGTCPSRGVRLIDAIIRMECNSFIWFWYNTNREFVSANCGLYKRLILHNLINPFLLVEAEHY